MEFAQTTDAINACFPALKVLRPHLDETTFEAQIRRQQQQGYYLAYLQRHNQVVSVGGFRVLEFLAWGNILYVDDLVTLPEMRGQGFAGLLLDHVIMHGRKQGCAAVHLDSGYQRFDAHRLYLKKGFQLACHHFALPLTHTAGV